MAGQNNALIPNENTIPGQLAYMYASSSSTTGQVATFADTSGGRLVGTSTPALGQLEPTLTGQSTTVALTAAQSGSVCFFDSAAGIVYTLPAPQVGLYFDFLVTVTITSNAAKFITKTTASQFLIGMPLTYISNTTPAAGPGPKGFAADGSTIVALSMNGTTTGGVIGTRLRVECVSSTLWSVSGLIVASGTIATAFATS